MSCGASGSFGLQGQRQPTGSRAGGSCGVLVGSGADFRAVSASVDISASISSDVRGSVSASVSSGVDFRAVGASVDISASISTVSASVGIGASISRNVRVSIRSGVAAYLLLSDAISFIDMRNVRRAIKNRVVAVGLSGGAQAPADSEEFSGPARENPCPPRRRIHSGGVPAPFQILEA